MTIERYLRLIAGVIIMATVTLGYYHSPYWFLLSIFVALNLIQSAFTNRCPMMTILRWLGAKEQPGTLSGQR
jgi:D-alanyl-lipoteichoic acid acyltransferase DltB (MBOAT superfamily)